MKGEVMPEHDMAMIRKVTWSGLGVNLILAGVKFLAGFLGSSQAVIADAVHTLSDTTTDIAVLAGSLFWAAPPDKEHPYGHLRIEALVTVVIGLVLVSVAAGLAYTSIASIHSGHSGGTGIVAAIGPALSIVCKELLYRWTARVGARVKSPAVIANAWHHRSDALSSIPALLAVVVASLSPGWGFVDHIGAVVVAVFILKVAWDIIVPALKELIDTGASLAAQRTIRALTMDVCGVKGAHAIRTRKCGSRIHVDLHILVNPELTVRAGHSISESVKRHLIDNGPDVFDVVVHLEPYEERAEGRLL
jgi:cation diffusion facilitator family transporter